MYQMTGQRHDEGAGEDVGHAYGRHEEGERDADAEGEQDYEVG